MKRDPLVLAENYILPGDDVGKSRPNANALIVGSTGCGKSMSVLLPTIFQSEHSNLVLSYAKEVDAYAMGKFLKSKGYAVDILNICHPEKSTISFDPVLSLTSYEDIVQLSTIIVDSTIKKTNDDYWQAKAKELLSSLIAAALMTSKSPETVGMIDVLELFDRTLPLEKGDGISTLLLKLFERLEQAAPNCFAVREYSSYSSLPYRTASCVRDTLAACLGTVFPESIRNVMQSKPPFRVDKFANRKSAILVITSAVNPGQQYYSNLFYRDTMHQLLHYAANCPNGELPREVRYIFDDFACTAPIPGFASDISLFRSAGISAIMLLQSEQQLDVIYRDDAGIIRQNCAVYAYFPGGFDDRSCQIVSKRMGLPYEDVMFAPLGKVFVMSSGRAPVHVRRYDTPNCEEYQMFLDITKPKKRSAKTRL